MELNVCPQWTAAGCGNDGMDSVVFFMKITALQELPGMDQIACQWIVVQLVTTVMAVFVSNCLNAVLLPPNGLGINVMAIALFLHTLEMGDAILTSLVNMDNTGIK